MSTLAVGGSLTINLRDKSAAAISSNGGFATVTVTPNGGAAVVSTCGPGPCRQIIGPYGEGATVLISNESSASFDVDVLSAPSSTVGGTLTASSTLSLARMDALTPVDAAGATTHTLPSAALSWAMRPFGILILVQKGVGVPSFAAAAGDTLRTPVGVTACVQYGMTAAQVFSATEWTLI